MQNHENGHYWHVYSGCEEATRCQWREMSQTKLSMMFLSKKQQMKRQVRGQHTTENAPNADKRKCSRELVQHKGKVFATVGRLHCNNLTARNYSRGSLTISRQCSTASHSMLLCPGTDTTAGDRQARQTATAAKKQQYKTTAGAVRPFETAISATNKVAQLQHRSSNSPAAQPQQQNIPREEHPEPLDAHEVLACW